MSKSPDHPACPGLPQAARSQNQRILYVPYPLLTVSDESAGGAEQMLWTLEREMSRRGVSTTVAASAGSRVTGELFITGEPCTIPDDFERRNLEHQDSIVELIRARASQGRSFDLVHDKSGSFWPRAAEIGIPVLATVHLPRHFYEPQYFENVSENVSFNCVSQAQAHSFTDFNPAVVSNGILLEHFQPNFEARRGLLWLGRICEEKAPHLALDIAAQAGQAITLAGQVYPLSHHQQYFDREVKPRLERMPNADFVSSPSAGLKRRLLRESKAVLITSLVDETSSIVAMEAAASGAPVIAFGRGALLEIVQEGFTGFLVGGVADAVDALTRIEKILPSNCAAYAQENFSSTKMADGYQELYTQILMAAAPSLIP
jgi:glycosyltransferase involved in cell wall biosynthesis